MKNLILAAAENYGADDLSPFVTSLRSSGYRGDVVFFVESNVSKDVLKLLQKHDVKAVALSRKRRWFAAWRPLVALLRQLRGARQTGSAFMREGWKQHIANSRFALCREYLLAHGSQYHSVILTDVRDVVFQEDPFHRPLESELCVFAEHSSRTIATSVSTAKWISRTYGNAAFQKVSDQPIVCSGVIMGSVAGISRLIDEMIEMMANCPSNWALRFGLDQPALNLLVYDRGITGLTIHSCLDGPATHLGLVPGEDLQFDDNGRVVDTAGNVLPVLHQYDRHACLRDLGQKAA